MGCRSRSSINLANQARFIIAKALDVSPTLRAAYGRAQRNDDHVGQQMEFRPIHLRVGQIFKV